MCGHINYLYVNSFSVYICKWWAFYGGGGVQIVGVFVLCVFLGNSVLLRNNQLIKLKGFLFERYR